MVVEHKRIDEGEIRSLFLHDENGDLPGANNERCIDDVALVKSRNWNDICNDKTLSFLYLNLSMRYTPNKDNSTMDHHQNYLEDKILRHEKPGFLCKRSDNACIQERGEHTLQK